MEYKSSNKYYRLLVFTVGIIATLAYRIIIILNYYSSFLVSISWYIGTIGFIWYFAHRYRVQDYRSDIILKRELVKKVSENKLSPDDREALLYILKSTGSSKAEWNSIMIFTLSGIALVYAVVVDIMRLFD